MTVTKAGFKSFQQQNITLVIGQIAEIDPQLQVGEQQEQVTVTSREPAIQTADSSVGLVIDAATITNTPLNGRLGITGLLALAPGVQGAGSQDQIPVYGVTPAINSGARNAYGAVGFYLDGGVNEWVSLQRPLGEVPPLDGVAEFKAITTNAPAQYVNAADIVVVSRGGTIQFHGLLVEFNLVAAASAKYYFAEASRKPQYIRNEFGGNFSGPILIPHLYNGRDRSFFFFNYEGFRLHQASNLNSQVPTTLERQGIFTEFPKPQVWLRISAAKFISFIRPTDTELRTPSATPPPKTAFTSRMTLLTRSIVPPTCRGALVGRLTRRSTLIEPRAKLTCTSPRATRPCSAKCLVLRKPI